MCYAAFVAQIERRRSPRCCVRSVEDAADDDQADGGGGAAQEPAQRPARLWWRERLEGQAAPVGRALAAGDGCRARRHLAQAGAFGAVQLAYVASPTAHYACVSRSRKILGVAMSTCVSSLRTGIDYRCCVSCPSRWRAGISVGTYVASSALRTRHQSTPDLSCCRSQASRGHWREQAAPTASWRPRPSLRHQPKTRLPCRTTGRMQQASSLLPAIRRASSALTHDHPLDRY